MERRFKLLLRIILFMLLLLPTPVMKAQELDADSSSELSLQDNTGGEKKKKKKAEVDFFIPAIEKLPASFFVRLIIDVFTVLILVRLIYFPIYHKKEFFFTFFLFNIVIFIVTYLLNKVDLSLGAAFGLFAVFSLLRYRTENISAKDMTYLFVVIAIGLISAVNKGTFLETLLINAIILVVAYTLDADFLIKNENIQRIRYENIDLIKPENHSLLLEDLKKRTGLNIHRISIDQINFLRDTATVTVHYYDSGKKIKNP